VTRRDRPRDTVDPDGREREPRTGDGPDRGQLLLVAAVIVAIALVPVVLSYLQLGYHPDTRAEAADTDPERNAERMLSRAVHEAAFATNGTWNRRNEVVERFRDRLGPRLETLRESRLEEGVAYGVAYNESAAADWADSNCPGGSDRQFGGCEARRGVVVQDRLGETHLLAVAVDLTVTTDRGRTELTLVVESVGGVDR